MPRKDRAQRPSLAEAFFGWLDKNGDDFLRRDRQKNSEEWQVDRFEPLLDVGTDRQDRVARLRKAAWQAAFVAVFHAEELYQRRQERQDHLKRAQEARELAASIGNFLGASWKDRPAYGIRGEDYKIILPAQIARYRNSTSPRLPIEDDPSTPSASADWDKILRAGMDLMRALERFAADRDHLDLPPSDGTDILGIIFVACIKGVSEKLFSKRLNARQLQLFALAAWHDMRLPLPDTRREKGAEEAWMEKKFSAYGNLSPRKKGQLGI